MCLFLGLLEKCSESSRNKKVHLVPRRIIKQCYYAALYSISVNKYMIH